MTRLKATTSGGVPPTRAGRIPKWRLTLVALFCLATVWLWRPAAAIQIDADSQYAFASQLYADRQFLEAAAEFQRFVFFFPEDPRAPEAGLKIARAYMHAGKYQEAIKAARKLAESGKGKQVTAGAYFIISRCYREMNFPTQAVATLHNLATLMQDPQIDDQVAYRLGWLYLQEGDWDRARQAFEKVSPAGRPDLGIEPILDDLSRASDLPRKNPKLAGALSIVPGAGQLYCGRYQDALIAFGVNVGLAWAAWESFDEGHEALGTVISFVALGFYMGNIYGAVTDAHKFNRQQTSRFVETLKRRHLEGRQDVYFRGRNDSPPAPAIAFRIRF